MLPARVISRQSAARNVRQPKAFTEVDGFVDCFRCPVRGRFVLIIIGPIGTGKSEFGRRSLRGRVGPVVGLPDFLGATDGNDQALDLSCSDVPSRVGVLTDGMADAETSAASWETMQGRAKVDIGGRSSTMMYAYVLFLCRSCRHRDHGPRCEEFGVCPLAPLVLLDGSH